VIDRHPDVRFELVGDGALRGPLQAAAAALGISEHVAFRGHCADVPAILAASDVFAFPSFMEASPNGVIEAMAAGLPVVATNVGGIPEIVEHGRSGLLVPPGDEAAFASALLTVIERPDLASALGDAARRTIELRYSFERMVGEFERVYADELRRDAPAPLPVAGSAA
jgi:glycosyltransferase involved in cell wall biosynthesis